MGIDLRPLVIAVALLGMLFSTAVWIIINLVTKSDEIISEKPLKPEIQLIIKNNKVDTLYVYKKP